jgi:hypothetical protein
MTTRRIFGVAAALFLAPGCGGDTSPVGGDRDAGADIALADTGESDVGATDTGGSDVNAEGGEPIALPVEATPTWTTQYGAYTNGAGRDKEGLVALVPYGDGVLLAADRRYGSNPSGNQLVLAQADTEGVITGTAFDLGRDTSIHGFELRSDGNFALVFEDEPVVAVVTAEGETVWALELGRDPYAFGGISVMATALDPADNLYLAGEFSPSEASQERGFVIRIDADGGGGWMRSWDHETFNEIQRVVADASGVYVSDLFPGRSEVSRRFGVLSYSSDGTERGAVELTVDSFDGPIQAVRRAALFMIDGKLSLVGTRSSAQSADRGLHVYRIALDAALSVESVSGTRIPTEDVVYSVDLDAAVESDGAVTILSDMGEGTTWVFRYPQGATHTHAYAMSPASEAHRFVDDEDYPTRVVATESGVFVAGTVIEAPTFTFEPISTVAMSNAVDVMALTETRYEDALLMTPLEDFTVTPGTDDIGVVDSVEDRDEDIVVLHVEF